PNKRYGTPYSPHSPPQPVPAPPQPRAWPWFLAYTVCMALLYVGVTALGVVAARGGAEYENAPTWVFLVLGPLLAIPYGIAPFLPKKPWTWTYHLVLIAIGSTSVCCLPATIPLLIQWLKPDMRRFFGRV
ncbi:MAG TPA: hypothetical protein VNO21_23625, partial [Polyangiaceae bacterium]|nr:hypothetical protein [Polyangiaceae bacterium]